MATAIEYGLIAAGISIAIITAVNGVGTTTKKWDDSAEKKAAAQACAARPASDTSNVVIKFWSGTKGEYKCPYFPSISYPTFVGTVN